MLKISLLSSLLVSMFVASWSEYQSYEGRFSILFPSGKVSTKIIPIETVLGKMEQKSFYFTPDEKDAENYFYQVTYVDYPTGTFHRDSTELADFFYKTSAETAAATLGGKLLYSENVDNQGIKGKIWRIDYNKGNAVMKSKAFLFGDRFFTISVATNKARSRNLDINKFLDSFHFLSLATKK
jgi:hypothetical protein